MPTEPISTSCLVDGFAWSGVHDVKYSLQASVRCTAVAPGIRAVEFGVEMSCGIRQKRASNLVALNVGCRAERRVVRRMRAAWPETERVGHQCDEGPYRCRVTSFTGDSSAGRGLNRSNPFYALRFAYVWPV